LAEGKALSGNKDIVDPSVRPAHSSRTRAEDRVPETAAGIAAEVSAGRIRAADVLERSLARYHHANPDLNAIIRLNPRALAEAEAVQTRLATGQHLPLAGVPVVIKDNLWVEGLEITQGSRRFAGFVAPEDATAVARLRAAGAVVLGIGATSELACMGVTNTPLYGMTRNPVDPRLTPGGSSGGPSVAVAAGFAPLALGTDAGGSTRRPPAHVGVIGFKPSQDLVPYGPGFDEPVWGISVVCPIARSMGDIALAMAVMSGVSPVGSGPVTLAYAYDFGLGQVLDDEVAHVTAAAVVRLRAAGFPVVDAAPVWPPASGRADVAPLQWAGLAALHGESYRKDPSLFGPGIAEQIEKGLAMTGVEVAEAHLASYRMGATLRAFLAEHRFLMTPTTPCPAWPVEDIAPRLIGGRPASPRDHAAFTPQANHAGCPAISLPCGKTRAGLPLGMQIMAAPGKDAELLGLAGRLAPVLAGAA
jgi:aspartyl-tRNA(Asn)/glutamyl-tRNA(Gln) amidotransferase subunit A